MSEGERNHDPLIGSTLGGLYHVERLIGVGGMGRVYEATHVHLGKAYAVKVLPEGRADKPDATARFLREAQSATKIEHDHIVKIVNFDSDEEHRLFIVMELLEGENLADRIDRGALPMDEAIEIARQTGDALQAAHDAGIVHRDLKPENIFITQKNGRDFVKVLDFGISKIKNPEHGDPKLTATDQIVGTPLYISPELARGVAAVDHRTDIYALGVIMYEMITGSPPFTGQNHFQLLYQHGNEAPDPPVTAKQEGQHPGACRIGRAARARERTGRPVREHDRFLCGARATDDSRVGRGRWGFRCWLQRSSPASRSSCGPATAPPVPRGPQIAVPPAVTEKSDDPRRNFRGRAPCRARADRAQLPPRARVRHSKWGQTGPDAAHVGAPARGGGDGTIFA